MRTLKNLISLTSLALSPKNIATFTLLFMSVQILGMEGFLISIPKVVYMCMSPLLLLALSPKCSKAVVLSVLFWGVTFLLNRIQFDNQRLSTFYYTAMFLSVFCLFYNLVWEEHCYGLDDFLKVVKMVIYAYAVCLILQQLVILTGRRYFPLFNLMDRPWQSLFHLNSLAIEPSHAARVLTVYFYAFLKLTEYKAGHPITLKDIYKKYKWPVLAFLYTMLAMGSGTAMVGLAILSLYFLKKQYAVGVLAFSVISYALVPKVDYEPINRAAATFEAALTMDEEEIREADRSASDRANMILSIKYTDLNDIRTWLGHGIDANMMASKRVTHMAIYDYGLISYLLKLLLFFSCSLCGVFSLSTLMFILLFSMNIGNIAYGFASLMIFSAVKYFHRRYRYHI